MRYCLGNIFQFPIELYFFIFEDNVDFFILTVKVDYIFIWNFIIISPYAIFEYLIFSFM